MDHFIVRMSHKREGRRFCMRAAGGTAGLVRKGGKTEWAFT